MDSDEPVGHEARADEDASPGSPRAASPGQKVTFGKPPFGWDYCFVFRAPKYAPGNVRHTSPPLRDNDSDSDAEGENYSPVNVLVVDADTGRAEFANQEIALDTEECLVVDESDVAIAESVETRCDIIARLRSAGFAFSQIYVPSESAVYLRFGLSNKKLQEKAEALGMELPLKEELGAGYVEFSRERRDLFKNANRSSLEEGNPYFCPSDRILIIFATLQSKETWGCDLDIERLVYKKKVLQAFAVHSKPEQSQLTKDVVYDRWWDPTWTPPFKKMKDYLGARVTLYFCFLSYYAKFLLPISIISIPAFVVTRVFDNELVIAALRCVFGISVVLWTTIFLERWKRRNAIINIEWGLNDYHEDTSDDTRPQFQGETRIGFYCKGGFVPLDDIVVANDADAERGNVETSDLPRNAWHEPRAARNALLLSLVVTSLCVSIVATLLFLILHFRASIVAYFTPRLGSFDNAIPGLLNAIVIAISDPIWRQVSVLLTRRENHRTNQRYENSIVLKRFSFQFFSNYSSLLYIAFVKPSGSCTNESCFDELESQMISLVISKATIQQILEIGVPFLVSRSKQFLSVRKGSTQMSDTSDGIRKNGLVFASSGDNQYVSESKLPMYASTIEDYAEIVIQFGYFSLFGVAFPCAALVNLLNNLIEVRTDALKILCIAQRTNADDAADIGTWYHILQFLGWASVLTNTGLLVFTNKSVETVLSTESAVAKVVAFFIIEHILFTLKGLAAGLIKDVPGRTYRQLARQDYDAARFLNEGWQNAFRGTSQLVVSTEHREMSVRQANIFTKERAEVDTDVDHVSRTLP